MKQCSLENCDNPGVYHKENGKYYLIKGMCNKHAARLRRHGSPLIQVRHKDGRTLEATYKIYCSMLGRCYTKSQSQYRDYGGRGIKVYKGWLGMNGYRNFLEHVGNRPSKKHSIDRINVNKDYEPGNVRWSLPSVQQNNRTNNRIVEYNGRKYTFANLIKKFGKDVSPNTYRYRLRAGWDINRIIETPARRKRNEL